MSDFNKTCIVCRSEFTPIIEYQDRCSKTCALADGVLGKEEYSRVSKELDRRFQEALRNSGFCKETTARWQHEQDT